MYIYERNLVEIKMDVITNKTCPAKISAAEEVQCTLVEPQRILLNERTIIKDPVCSIEKRKNTVVVSNKANFKGLLAKCERLLNNDVDDVYIHGLGAAVNKACKLALQLQQNHKGTLELDIQTSTVKLYDNIIPDTDDDDLVTKERLNSAIQIRVYRTIPITCLKYKKV